MADSKSVDLFLRVTTVLMGGDVIGKLSTGFGGLHKQVGIVNQAMGKLVGAAAAITIGYKGISAASDWLKEGVKGAKQFRDANEILAINLQRFPHIMKLGEEGIRDYQKRIGETTERLQETGLLLKGDLMKGFQELIAKGMNPDRVFKIGDAFQGLAIRMGKTGEETADLINRFIVGKRPPIELREALAEVGIELDKYAKLSKKGKGVALMEEMTKTKGLTEYVTKYLETIPGKEAKIAQQSKVMAEKVGDPILKLQESWTQATGEMQKAMKPVVDMLSKELMIQVEKFAKWLSDPKTIKGMQDFGQGTKDAFQWIKDNWQPISHGLTAIGIAMGGLAIVAIITNPLLLAVGAVSALGVAVTLLSMNWQFLKPYVDAAIQPMKDIWKIVEPGLKEAGTKIVQFFKGEIKWDECWTGVYESVSKIKWDEVGKTLLKGLTDSLSGLGDALRKIDWDKVWQGVGAAMVDALVVAFKVAYAIGTFPIELGKAIGDGLIKINWIDVFMKVDEAITRALLNMLIGAWNNAMGKMGFGFAKITPIAAPAIEEAKKGFEAYPIPSVPMPEIPVSVEAFEKQAEIAAAIPSSVQETINKTNEEAGAAKGVTSEIGSWDSSLNVVVMNLDRVQSKMGEIETAAGKVNTALSGLNVPVPQVGLTGVMQHGGITRGPTIAGEAGPEMILPLNQPGRWRQIIEGLSSFGMARGARGGEVSVQVSPNITINGVGRGEAEAVGREVQKAMQDPINRLLESLAKARDEERRLAYV